MFLILYYLICLKILIELFWITTLSRRTFFRARIFRSLKNPETLGSTASRLPKEGAPSTSFVIQNNSIKIFNPPPLPLPLDQT